MKTLGNVTGRIKHSGDGKGRAMYKFEDYARSKHVTANIES